MGLNKPLVTMWSHAALDFAGASLPRLQTRLLREVRAIAAEADGWFAHIIELDDGTVLYCRASDEQDFGWLVIVQLGEVCKLEPEPGAERFMGDTLRMPAALESDTNERFKEVGDIEN